MGLIPVGIHENLTFGKGSKINDKGTLELVIESRQSPDALLDAFTSNTTYSQMKNSFRFYPPNMDHYEKEKGKKSAAEIAQEILKIRHQFMEYGKLVGPKEDAEAAFGGLEMFKGLGIPDDQLSSAISRLNNEEFMKKVVTNLSTKFLNYLESKNAVDRIMFRHKFLRQSADKNYATIPNSDYEPWVESMDIPKTASKIAYTKWEIDNKKNNPDPGTISKSESKEEDVNKGKSLFGGGSKNKPKLS